MLFRSTYRAIYLEPTGRLEEAVTAQKRAMSLDPRNSLLGLRLANLYRALGQCDEAIRQARLNAANEPAVPIHLAVAASCFEQQGKFKEAIAANRQVKIFWVTDALLDTLDKAFAKEGGQGYFRAMLSHQKSLAAKRNDAWYFVAIYSAYLNDWESVFRALNRAIDLHDRSVVYLKNEPVFSPMRNDPRFKAALKRLNLE